MYKCNAWELWRTQNQITDVLLVVNLEPMEGLPVIGHQVDWRISVYFREEDLAEYIGELDDREMALITREYLRIREWDRMGCPFLPSAK